MKTLATTMTKLALALLALGTLLAQVLLPLAAWEVGTKYPEVRGLVVPYSVASVLTLVCVQVALVAVWMLVTAISRDALFGARSLVLIDLIRVAAVGATAIPAAVLLHLLVIVGLGGPGVLLGLAAVGVTGAAVTLLLTLGRRVYLKARDEHIELETVI